MTEPLATAEAPLPVLSTRTALPRAVWVARDIVFLVVFIALTHIFIEWCDGLITLPKFWKRKVVFVSGFLVGTIGYVIVAGWGRQAFAERLLRMKYAAFMLLLAGLPALMMLCFFVARWDLPNTLLLGLSLLIDNSLPYIAGFFISLATAPPPKKESDKNVPGKSDAN